MSSSLDPVLKGTGKASRRLPEGAKEILQDFVVAVLRSKISKDRFIKFAVDWFRKLLDDEEKKAQSPKKETLTRDDVPETTRGELNSHRPVPDQQRVSVPATSQPTEATPIGVGETTPEQVKKQSAPLVSEAGAVASAEHPESIRTTLGGHVSATAHGGGKLSSMASGASQNQNQAKVSLPKAPEQLVPEANAENQAQPLATVPEPSPSDNHSTFEHEEHRGSAARRQGVSAESYDPSVPQEHQEPPKTFPKTEEQLQRVKDAVREVLLFRSLDEEQLLKVVDALEEVHVVADQNVITLGDENADYFYVIESGEFDCFGPDNVKLHEYIGKGSFGELALMYNQPRAATVRAKTAGALWRLDRETFKRIIVRGAYEKRQLYMSLLEKVDFIADLQNYEKQNICDALVGKTYSPGDVVMRQGDAGDGMYFVESGEVVCMRNDEGADKEIGRAGPGDYVGELALIANQQRAATVTASESGAKLAFLDAKAFERLMGPCVNILKKNVDRYRDKMVAAFGDNYAQFLH